MDANRGGNDNSLMCDSIFSMSLTAVWDGRRAAAERQREKKNSSCLNCFGIEPCLGRQEKKESGCQLKQTKQRLREREGDMTTRIARTEQGQGGEAHETKNLHL